MDRALKAFSSSSCPMLCFPSEQGLILTHSHTLNGLVLLLQLAIATRRTPISLVEGYLLLFPGINRVDRRSPRTPARCHTLIYSKHLPKTYFK